MGVVDLQQCNSSMYGGLRVGAEFFCNNNDKDDSKDIADGKLNCTRFESAKIEILSNFRKSILSCFRATSNASTRDSQSVNIDSPNQ